MKITWKLLWVILGLYGVIWKIKWKLLFGAHGLGKNLVGGHWCPSSCKMMPWVGAERLERMGKRISSLQPNDVLVLNYQYHIGFLGGLDCDNGKEHGNY